MARYNRGGIENTINFFGLNQGRHRVHHVWQWSVSIEEGARVTIIYKFEIFFSEAEIRIDSEMLGVLLRREGL